MFGIGGTEFFIIAVVVLMLFGPDKIPQIARTIGRFTREFKRYQAMMESVVKAEMYGIDLNPAEDRERAAREYRKKAGIKAPGEETPGGLPVDEPEEAAGDESPSAGSDAETAEAGGYSSKEYADYDPELLAPELADTGWTPGSSDAPTADEGEEAGGRA